MFTKPLPQANKIHGLPQDFHKFTAKAGAGSMHSNLAASLHHLTSSSSNVLHPLKKHVGAITKVFDKDFIKRKIRSGGLSAGEQKTVFRKIIEEDKEIASDTLAKNTVKKMIAHFGHNVGKARDRIDRFIEQGKDIEQAQGISSANKLNTDARTSVQKYHSAGETFNRSLGKSFSSANKLNTASNKFSSAAKLGNRPLSSSPPLKSNASSPRIGLAV